jgi:hypothetical protein
MKSASFSVGAIQSIMQQLKNYKGFPIDIFQFLHENAHF